MCNWGWLDLHSVKKYHSPGWLMVYDGHLCWWGTKQEVREATRIQKDDRRPQFLSAADWPQISIFKISHAKYDASIFHW